MQKNYQIKAEYMFFSVYVAKLPYMLGHKAIYFKGFK